MHAIRNLARIGFGTTVVRYSQLGFGRTSSTSREQVTPRNMMGFKDGTRNLKLEDTAKLDQHLWVQPGDGPDWMVGGSYPASAPVSSPAPAACAPAPTGARNSSADRR